MTQPRVARTLIRSALFIGAVSAAAGVALALPVLQGKATSAQRARAIVRVTKVGLSEVQVAGDSLVSPILVYSTGNARIGLAGASLVPLTDTLRLYRLPAITADVTDGDVHLVLKGTGQLVVGADVTGGSASHVGATGSHIVLMKGGVGIRSVP
jgi:hypothetical protein